MDQALTELELLKLRSELLAMLRLPDADERLALWLRPRAVADAPADEVPANAIRPE